jgi:peptidoglycan/LPS O-acetylase OafA/YrhL
MNFSPSTFFSPQTGNNLSHSDYRPDIDGLRAFAVLAVVGYHFFPYWVKGGFVGVDVFFVISGFLIGGILLDSLANDSFSLRGFYARRVRRIFPALIVVMASSLAFGWFALLPDDYQNLGKHVAGGAGFIANLLLWKEAGYFDAAAERKLLLHLWSLGVEEQFYIFFPLFLWGLWKKNLRLVTFLALLTWGSYRWNLVTYKKDPVFDFYSPMTRFWELLAGVLLALWERRRGEGTVIATVLRRWGPHGEKIAECARRVFFRDAQAARGQGDALRSFVSLLGVSLLVLALVKAQAVKFPGKQALVPVFGAVCLIAAGPKAWANRVLFSLKPAVWIGLISYPLYLWHWPLLSYARIILGEMPDRTFRIGMVLLAILLATLTYWLIERPVRFGHRGRRNKTAALVVLMVIIGSVGGWIFEEKGIPARKNLPTKAANLTMNYDKLLLFNPENHSCAQIPGYYEDNIKIYQTCDYQDVNGNTTVALIGYSHARVIFPDVAAYDASKGVNTLVLWRPAFANPVNGETHLQYPDKEDNIRFSEWVFQVLESDPKIHKVFLFASADEKMQDAIDRLHAKNKKVYVVELHPRLPFDIKSVLPEQPFRPKKETHSPRSREDKRFNAEREQLNRLRNATIVDTRDVFCPTSECLVFDGAGRPLYFDNEHLTPGIGGRLLLEKALKPCLDE